MSANCADCKHCPEDWMDKSQLPLCSHPDAERSKIDGRLIWALYATEPSGHCGARQKHFELRVTP
jgi:hypothetical protein